MKTVTRLLPSGSIRSSVAPWATAMREPSGAHAIEHPSAPSPQVRTCRDVPSDTSITQTPPVPANASLRPSAAHVRSPSSAELTGSVFNVLPVIGSIKTMALFLGSAIAPLRARGLIGIADDDALGDDAIELGGGNEATVPGAGEFMSPPAPTTATAITAIATAAARYAERFMTGGLHWRRTDRRCGIEGNAEQTVSRTWPGAVSGSSSSQSATRGSKPGSGS